MRHTASLSLVFLLGLALTQTNIAASEPGYLDFDNLPETNFSCNGKVIGGYYADVETGCQMFHVCTIGQKGEITDIKFLCLNGTVFDQETRVCERIDEVDCARSESFFGLNLELYGNQPASLGIAPEEPECGGDCTTSEEEYDDEVDTTTPPPSLATTPAISTTTPMTTTQRPPRVTTPQGTTLATASSITQPGSQQAVAALLALHNVFSQGVQPSPSPPPPPSAFPPQQGHHQPFTTGNPPGRFGDRPQPADYVHGYPRHHFPLTSSQKPPPSANFHHFHSGDAHFTHTFETGRPFEFHFVKQSSSTTPTPPPFHHPRRDSSQDDDALPQSAAISVVTSTSSSTSVKTSGGRFRNFPHPNATGFPATAYEEYKEGDTDPFFHDVPKILRPARRRRRWQTAAVRPKRSARDGRGKAEFLQDLLGSIDIHDNERRKLFEFFKRSEPEMGEDLKRMDIGKFLTVLENKINSVDLGESENARQKMRRTGKDTQEKSDPEGESGGTRPKRHSQATVREGLNRADLLSSHTASTETAQIPDRSYEGTRKNSKKGTKDHKQGDTEALVDYSAKHVEGSTLDHYGDPTDVPISFPVEISDELVTRLPKFRASSVQEVEFQNLSDNSKRNQSSNGRVEAQGSERPLSEDVGKAKGLVFYGKEAQTGGEKRKEGAITNGRLNKLYENFGRRFGTSGARRGDVSPNEHDSLLGQIGHVFTELDRKVKSLPRENTRMTLEISNTEGRGFSGRKNDDGALNNQKLEEEVLKQITEFFEVLESEMKTNRGENGGVGETGGEKIRRGGKGADDSEKEALKQIGRFLTAVDTIVRGRSEEGRIGEGKAKEGAANSADKENHSGPMNVGNMGGGGSVPLQSEAFRREPTSDDINLRNPHTGPKVAEEMTPTRFEFAQFFDEPNTRTMYPGQRRLETGDVPTEFIQESVNPLYYTRASSGAKFVDGTSNLDSLDVPLEYENAFNRDSIRPLMNLNRENDRYSEMLQTERFDIPEAEYSARAAVSSRGKRQAPRRQSGGRGKQEHTFKDDSPIKPVTEYIDEGEFTTAEYRRGAAAATSRPPPFRQTHPPPQTQRLKTRFDSYKEPSQDNVMVTSLPPGKAARRVGLHSGNQRFPKNLSTVRYQNLNSKNVTERFVPVYETPSEPRIESSNVHSVEMMPNEMVREVPRRQQRTRGNSRARKISSEGEPQGQTFPSRRTQQVESPQPPESRPTLFRKVHADSQHPTRNVQQDPLSSTQSHPSTSPIPSRKIDAEGEPQGQTFPSRRTQQVESPQPPESQPTLYRKFHADSQHPTRNAQQEPLSSTGSHPSTSPIPSRKIDAEGEPQGQTFPSRRTQQIESPQPPESQPTLYRKVHADSQHPTRNLKQEPLSKTQSNPPTSPLPSRKTSADGEPRRFSSRRSQQPVETPDTPPLFYTEADPRPSTSPPTDLPEPSRRVTSAPPTRRVTARRGDRGTPPGRRASVATTTEMPPQPAADMVPDPNFACEGKVKGGFYADIASDCRGFFICSQGEINGPLLKTHFWCGTATKFNQRSRTCQAESLVECSVSLRYYHLNDDFRVPETEEELLGGFEPTKVA